MSASLVGSEMCIRDRPLAEGSCPQLLPPAEGALTSERAPEARHGSSPLPPLPRPHTSTPSASAQGSSVA
eukprot:13302107-Alexandrium_andersonii.AAC.1